MLRFFPTLDVLARFSPLTIATIKLLLESEEEYNKILSEPIFNPECNITLDSYKSYLNSKLDYVLGFTPRIFSSNTHDSKDNSKISILLNKTCLHKFFVNKLIVQLSNQDKAKA